MQLVRLLTIAWMWCAAVVALPVTAQEVQLPERAAAPSSKPQVQDAPAEPAASDPEADQDRPASRDVPVPEPRPEEPEIEADEPTPMPRPGAVEPVQSDPEEPAPPRAEPPSEPRPQAAGSLVPPEEMACRARLTALGVVFEVRPAEADSSGCAMPYPLSVSTLSRDIALEPAALVNCAIAEAAARFAQDTVAPEAQQRFGSRLEAVRQVSGYVCRPRNGTSTLSEHAFGNALDFGAFVLADGRTIEVRASSDPKTSGFLRRVRSEACGPFTTVLGPGSDADHADHFHFDLAERSNASTYCR